MPDGELFPQDQPTPPEFAVHPIAAKFPMLPEHELAELAEDIKANGLLHAIVRTQDGTTIVDGRNRLAACRLAEIEPRFDDRIKNDAEARALIYSANVQRRNITAAQRVMGIALLYPELDPPGRGKKASATEGISSGRLSMARAVLRFSVDLADAVLAGEPLDVAYEQATALERKRKRIEENTRRLRQVAPALVQRVDAKEITLDEARVLWESQERENREKRRVVYQLLHEIKRLAEGFINTPSVFDLPGWLAVEEYETEFREFFKGGIPELNADLAALAEAGRVGALLTAKLPGRKARK